MTYSGEDDFRPHGFVPEYKRCLKKPHFLLLIFGRWSQGIFYFFLFKLLLENCWKVLTQQLPKLTSPLKRFKCHFNSAWHRCIMSSAWKAKLYRNSVNNVMLVIFQFNNGSFCLYIKTNPGNNFQELFIVWWDNKTWGNHSKSELPFLFLAGRCTSKSFPKWQSGQELSFLCRKWLVLRRGAMVSTCCERD